MRNLHDIYVDYNKCNLNRVVGVLGQWCGGFIVHGQDSWLLLFAVDIDLIVQEGEKRLIIIKCLINNNKPRVTGKIFIFRSKQPFER